MRLDLEFTYGEGSLLIRIAKSLNRGGSIVQLVFTISQYIRVESLLKCLINY